MFLKFFFNNTPCCVDMFIIIIIPLCWSSRSIFLDLNDIFGVDFDLFANCLELAMVTRYGVSIMPYHVSWFHPLQNKQITQKIPSYLKEFLTQNQLSCLNRNCMKLVAMTLTPPKTPMKRIKVFLIGFLIYTTLIFLKNRSN